MKVKETAEEKQIEGISSQIKRVSSIANELNNKFMTASLHMFRLQAALTAIYEYSNTDLRSAIGDEDIYNQHFNQIKEILETVIEIGEDE